MVLKAALPNGNIIVNRQTEKHKEIKNYNYKIGIIQECDMEMKGKDSKKMGYNMLHSC